MASLSCAVLSIYQQIGSNKVLDLEDPSLPRSPSTPLSPRTFALFFIPLIPALGLLISLPPKLYTPTTTVSAAHLHPESPKLLSVLLITAPRPGNPDFLLRTIDSWLTAFPDPDYHYNWTSLPIETPSLSSRLRLVVYTQFSDHPQFDNARDLFTSSKGQHYLTFHRDPRSVEAGNRLDQRLHVARALDYASKEEDSAYVSLTEDDFPLCEDPSNGAHGLRNYEKTMAKLERALVETNRLLPDPTSSSNLGHCGLFAATGGSGLIIRNSIASILPSVFLGPNDPQGLKRESLAAQGQHDLSHDGPDTSDLVIQDRLRGRLPECSMCAPSPSFDLPKSSARMPWGVVGDRYGKSGMTATERVIQRHLGYPESTFPGRSQDGSGWRQPFNGEPDVLVV
ncbi:hypothetical protein JCM5353_006190 [Sporobolomyces roseus]